MGDEGLLNRAKDGAGDLIEKVDPKKAQEVAEELLDKVQDTAGGLGDRAEPLVEKDKRSIGGPLEKAKDLLGDDAAAGKKSNKKKKKGAKAKAVNKKGAKKGAKKGKAKKT